MRQPPVSPQEAPTSAEPLSPELVLVSPPEVADQARAALPARPWEQWLPFTATPAEKRLVLEPLPATAAASPLPVLRPPAVPAQTAPQQHRALPRVAPRQEPAQRLGLSRLLAPVATIALTLAAVTWASEQTPTPRLEVEQPGSAVAGVPPSAATSGGPRTSKTEGTASGPAVVAPRGERASPVPLGGYIFREGRLVVSADGRSVETLELTGMCPRTLRLRGLRIGPQGTFSYAGRVAGGSVQALIDGRFLDARRVSVRGVLRGKGCAERPLAAVGSLS